MKPVRCPICVGTGTYWETPCPDISSSTGYYRACHGCDGKGWVEVHEESNTISNPGDDPADTLPWHLDNTTLKEVGPNLYVSVY